VQQVTAAQLHTHLPAMMLPLPAAMVRMLQIGG
jgi:hypothetical protein